MILGSWRVEAESFKIGIFPLPGHLRELKKKSLLEKSLSKIEADFEDAEIPLAQFLGFG